MRVTDLIRYNDKVRELFFDAMVKLPWCEVSANKGLSFDSMRNVFLHLTVVEDRWISYIIPGRFKEWRDPDFDAYYDMDSLKRNMDAVHNRTEVYLSKFTPEESTRLVAVHWGGKEDLIPVEGGLTHMVLEDMIHYGELSAALWQMGLEAPYWGFWRTQIKTP